MTEPATGLRYLDVPDFELQKGGVLPLARLAYRTLGTLNAARDNAVLVPIGFSADDEAVEEITIGLGRALDPAELFIILVNQTGSGRSSSPSNTPPPFDRDRFPRVTLHDNVRLQHRLVTEELGIERLRLITGWSMGGAQCYQWGAQYPDAMLALAPVAASARTAVYNRVFLYALRRTLTLDPSFRDGRYEAPPLAGLKAFATIYAGWGLSEPFYRTRAYEALGAADLEDFVRQFWEPHFTACDANDLLSQIWTWEHTDISDDPRYGGDLDAALGAIRARTIVLPVDQDRYFPPVDAEAEVARMPNAECRVLRSDWGHYAPRNPEDWPAIDAALGELLEG